MLAGPGRLGLRRSAVARAGEQLTGWHATWAPHLPGLHADNARLLRLAAGNDYPDTVGGAPDAAARRAAGAAHPEHAALTSAADAAERTDYTARRELDRVRDNHDNRHGTSDPPDYPRQRADTERDLATTRRQLTDIRVRITALQADLTLLAEPERLRQESQDRRYRRDAARTTPRPTAAAERAVRDPRPENLRHLVPHCAPGRGIGR